MLFIPRKFNRSGQNLSEYSLLLALIMGGIIIGGPMAINSWNAQAKSWNDSVIDSFTDPLLEAEPLEAACHCDEDWSVPNIPADCGIDGCHWSQAKRTRSCNPLGCGTESECVADEGCCSVPSLLPGCGDEADSACAGGCPDGEQCGSFQCGSDPTIQYGCFPGECGRCIGGPYFPDEVKREFIGLCPGDDEGFIGDVDYNFVPEGGCTDAGKCEIECRLPFSPQAHSGGACACPDNRIYDPMTDECVCPPWTTEDENGNCVVGCSQMTNDGTGGAAVVMSNGNIMGTNGNLIYSGGDAICVGESGKNCWVTRDGNAHCTGFGGPYNYTGGDAVAVGRGTHNTCVMTSDGNINCTQSADYSGGDAIKLTVNDFHLGAFSFGASWATAGSDIVGACRGYQFSATVSRSGEMTFGPIRFNGGSPGIDIDCGVYMACALFESGLVHCIGRRHVPLDQVFPGAREVSVGWTTATIETSNVCVLLDDGSVDCYGYAPNPDFCCAW